MKIVYSNIIPVKGFTAINLFGVLFVRKEYEGKLSEKTMNHESIHTAQMKELGYIGFYVIYLLEWIYRLIFHTSTAYRGISFEREAYCNQDYKGYTEYRKPYSMWR